MAREVLLRRVEEGGFLLHRQRLDVRARITRVLEVAPDLGRWVERDQAVLNQLVEGLPYRCDNIPHEAAALALREEVGDESPDIIPRHSRHQLAAEAREGMALQVAEVERLRTDAELPELTVRSEPAPSSLLKHRHCRVVEQRAFPEGEFGLNLF